MFSVILIILLIWFIISFFKKMHVCYMENYIGMVLTLNPQGGFLNSKDVSISIGLLEEEALCWILLSSTSTPRLVAGAFDSFLL